VFGFDVDFVNISSGGAYNYTWSFGDNSTSNAVSPHHTYLNAGTYLVRLIIQNACTKDTIQQVLLIGGLSADPTQTGGIVLEIFPNPSDGESVGINLSGLSVQTKELSVKVIDVSGHTLLEKNYPGNGEQKIHLQLNTRELNLSKGVYWIELETGGQKAVRKWAVY
jgi:PKD repeat protein